MSLGRILFDQQAFRANYEYFRSRALGDTGAVIKANGYGTGSVRATRLLEKSGCKHFFVALTEEALEIKTITSGVIYILSGPKDEEEATKIASEGFVPVLNSSAQINMWKPFRDSACAIHVDTGMQRLGIAVEDCRDRSLGSLNICLVMTHLSCADNPQHPENRKQVQVFEKVLPFFRGVPTSIGNSAGILNGEEFQGDVVRPGIGLYGGNPWQDRHNPLLPVVSCEGMVLQIRRVQKGESVGYSASYVANDAIRVATIGLGYADGIPRNLSNRGECTFKGIRLSIVGHVSMDATQVDCTKCPELVEGDFIQFFGDTISVDEVAQVAGTIPYEVLTRLGSRF